MPEASTRGRQHRSQRVVTTITGEFEPSAGGGGAGTVNVHNVVMLDGSKIAEVLNSHTMAEMNFPRQAPMFDGRSAWSTPDWSPMHGMA